MSSVVIAGNTSGTITLDAPLVAGSNTLTLPASTGTVLTSVSPASDLPSSIKGPAFSASPSSNTTISSATSTVTVNNDEQYDTAGCYNNTGSTVTLNGISVPAYSFAPNVAGYYNFSMVANTELSVSPTRVFVIIAKNGVDARLFDNQTAAIGVFGGSIMYYMNGTSDYVTAKIWLSATTPRYSGGFDVTRFQGVFVRGA